MYKNTFDKIKIKKNKLTQLYTILYYQINNKLLSKKRYKVLFKKKINL